MRGLLVLVSALGDPFAEYYDAWATADQDDVSFYVEQARGSGGPVLELGVGTGRVAVATALAGVRVIGVDASERMLAICRRRAEEAGVSALVDVRLGDFREPPVDVGRSPPPRPRCRKPA